MPVSDARIVIDPQQLDATRVDVRLDVQGTRSPLPLAAQALKAPDMLNAAEFPEIRFRSEKVTRGPGGRLSDGATVTGELTLRDMRKRVQLRADLFREQGSAPSDLSSLQVTLRGVLSRSAFGLTAYPNLVADTVLLDILAVMRA